MSAAAGSSSSSSSTSSSPAGATLSERKNILLDRLTQPAEDESSPIVLIMGNEAGDTDSLASSILLADLLSQSHKPPHLDKFPASTIYVPIIQQPRKDLVLRPENEVLIAMLGWDPTKDLVFLDDLPSPDKLLRKDIFLGLTDHPQLSTYWQPHEELSKKVEIVVDHHADSRSHSEAALRILKGPENGAVGSAVSVVVDMFQQTQELQSLGRPLADLGLAAILIDTDNLRPTPQGKATPVDINAAKSLLRLSSFASGETGKQAINLAVKVGGEIAKEAIDHPSQENHEALSNSNVASNAEARSSLSQYYQILTAKKLDVSRLGTHELLRRDYKENHVDMPEGNGIEAGFSSVPVGLSDWVHERHGDSSDNWDQYWTTIRDWMKERRLDVAVVGTSYRAGSTDDDRGKHKRELILAFKHQSSTRDLFPILMRYLEADSYSSEMGNDASLQLSLDSPWKGARRVEETGKKERVGGLKKDGRCRIDEELRVAVWMQRNQRASRKVYLPAVLHALQKAAKSR